MPSGYMKVGMWSKKPKAIFLERYCMLQSWPDYSDPTVYLPSLICNPCLRVTCMTIEGSPEDVRRVSGKCLEGILKVYGSCQEDVWKVSRV